MKLRKLKYPCEHDQYEDHYTHNRTRLCPGGVFLPDDTLIIEKEGGEWPTETIELIAKALMDAWQADFDDYAIAVLDVLSVREGGETP